MSRIPDFIKYLESHIGDAYVWGAQGQCISDMTAAEFEDWLERREEKESNRDRVRQYVILATKKPLYAFDCSGLIMYYLQNLKGWASSDTNANGLYGQCKGQRGELTPDIPLKAGDLLFRDSGGRKTHVGVYIGNGYQIEAKGRDYGVVKHKVSYTYWTHYGTHPVLQEEDAPKAPTVIRISSPLMRGEDIKALQTALNLMGYDAGEADGIAGTKTLAAVQAFAMAHLGETVMLPAMVEAQVVVEGRAYKGWLEA